MVLLLLLCTSNGCNKQLETLSIANKQIWTIEDRRFVLEELNRTTNEIRDETVFLTEVQASFRENDDRWSITEIIEHLEVQNELHFREIRAISKTPQLLQYVDVVTGQDGYYQEYATDTARNQLAQWYLEPIGRFGTKKKALEAFIRTRGYFIDFVKTTDIDLRKHFTFRRNIEHLNIEDLKTGDVRDLHQLLLTGIAHTDRHLNQIRKIKENPDFPKS